MRHTMCLGTAVVCLLTAILSQQASGADWTLNLPEGGTGYSFGPTVIQGLTAVSRQTAYNDQTGYGFTSGDAMTEGRRAWPDKLSGKYVAAASKAVFQAKVPNGDYCVWLCAGKLITENPKDRHFLLTINDKTLCDDTPGDEAYASEKYLYRFMWTQYSARPHGTWEDYIDKMYASFTERVTVRDGHLTVSFGNHFISALILVPVAQKAGFDALLADIRGKRVEEFESDYRRRIGPDYFNNLKPAVSTGGDCLVYVPSKQTTEILSDTVPSDDERKQTRIKAAGTPGELVLMKLVVVPFADLGASSLELSDLKGPTGTIASGNINGFFKNYHFYRRYDGKTLVMGECALLPSLTLNMEKGVTQLFCLLLRVPEDAKAGLYEGTFTFKPGHGDRVSVPVRFEVYPFRLEKDLPVSYTMWNSLGYDLPFLPVETRHKILKERLIAQREIGFTSLDVPGPRVRSAKDGKATIIIDATPYDLAKEVGMGRRPEQALYMANFMAASGRSLASVLHAGSGGAELKNPEFKTYLKDVIAQYKAFIDKSGLPVVVCAVDEPREKSMNDWNRNYDDTCVYADLMREGGLRTMINPMRDITYGKDYTGIVDHLDVYSSHAWNKSERSFHLAKEKGKTVWLYNSGMDRYSWGFYNWRFQSQGRMEWAFDEIAEESEFGYPGQDWFNPFGSRGGRAPSAPYTKYKGGHLLGSCYYEVSMGITDYAYLYTLTEAMKKAGADKSATVKAASEFLTDIQKAMPEFAKIEGLDSGAQVGMRALDEARHHVDEWRATIASFLKELAK